MVILITHTMLVHHLIGKGCYLGNTYALFSECCFDSLQQGHKQSLLTFELITRC
jgi:hypothetical protein